MTPLKSALNKLESITAKGVALTVPEAVALRNALGGRQVVREQVKAGTGKRVEKVATDKEAHAV